MDLRILSYNLRFGGRGREDLLIEILRCHEPDFVMLQEATRPVIVERLAHALKATAWTARRGASLAFLSRLPIKEWNRRRVKGVKHAFLDVKLESPPLRMLGAHLRPRFSKWGERSRVREIRALLEVLSMYGRAEHPHLLIGDFNTIAPGDEVRIDQMPLWIRALIRISGGEIHSDAIRTLLEIGYLDGFRKCHPDQGGFTFPTFSPQVRLDYVFLSPELSEGLKDCRVVEDPPAVTLASDHFPLYAAITV